MGAHAPSCDRASSRDSNFIVLRRKEITCNTQGKILRFEMRGLGEIRGPVGLDVP